jgi:hypothetical protein
VSKSSISGCVQLACARIDDKNCILQHCQAEM